MPYRSHQFHDAPVYRILIIWLVAVVSFASSSKADEWPRLLGKDYDGVAPASAAKLDWTKPLEPMWSIPVGDGYGLGSLAAGRYFQMDAVPSETGRGIDERLRCFEAKSGKLVWSQSQAVDYADMYGYESGPRGTPAVSGDRVVSFGVAGHLTCRSTEDGKILWTVDTNTKYGVIQNFFGVGSSPMVWNDLVIVMVGGSPAEDARIPPGRLDRVSPNGSALVAFDLATGEERWRCGDDLASYSSPRPITVDGKSFILAFARGGLIAVDPEQGKLLWRFDHRADLLESVNAMVPVVIGSQVFLSECYEVGSVLLDVRYETVTVRWRDPAGDRRRQAMRVHWSTPVVMGDVMFGCSGRNAPDSDFRCIEWETGTVRWIDPRRARSSVTRVDDHLIVLEERGTLEVLKANPDRLEQVAAWDLTEPGANRPAIGYPCWSAPIVVGDTLLVRGDTDVLALRVSSGSSLNRERPVE